jgi:hypothetical protein
VGACGVSGAVAGGLPPSDSGTYFSPCACRANTRRQVNTHSNHRAAEQASGGPRRIEAFQYVRTSAASQSSCVCGAICRDLPINPGTRGLPVGMPAHRQRTVCSQRQFVVNGPDGCRQISSEYSAQTHQGQNNVYPGSTARRQNSWEAMRAVSCV